MEFSGAQQTCFSDWGRTVIEFFPQAKFGIDGEKVLVFEDNAEVGHYDFSTGTGSLVSTNGPQPPENVGRLPSFTPIDIDSFIQ